MTETQFCDACGWLRPIVEEKTRGKKTVRLCKDCVSTIDSAEALLTMPDTKVKPRTVEPKTVEQREMFGFKLGFVLGSALTAVSAWAITVFLGWFRL